MNIVRKKKPFIDGLESGALTDLSFLLIIYFIVIAGFSVQQGFLLDLPGKNSTKLVFVDDVMRLSLKDDGSVFLLQGGAESPVPRTEVEGLVSGALSRQPNLTVALSIEPGVPWQYVVGFVELSQKLKVENFSFNIRVTRDGEGS